MCKAGNKVIFDINRSNPKQGGYIENKLNGSKTFMEVNQVTGEFQFDLWVRNPPRSTKATILTHNKYGALQAVGGAKETPEVGFPRPAQDPL